MKKILIILPVETHEKLKQLASDNDRSMNKTVVRLIEQATKHINSKGEI